MPTGVCNFWLRPKSGVAFGTALSFGQIKRSPHLRRCYIVLILLEFMPHLCPTLDHCSDKQSSNRFQQTVMFSTFLRRFIHMYLLISFKTRMQVSSNICFTYYRSIKESITAIKYRSIVDYLTVQTFIPHKPFENTIALIVKSFTCFNF